MNRDKKEGERNYVGGGGVRLLNATVEETAANKDLCVRSSLDGIIHSFLIIRFSILPFIYSFITSTLAKGSRADLKPFLVCHMKALKSPSKAGSRPESQ